jgi:hypothetical protein
LILIYLTCEVSISKFFKVLCESFMFFMRKERFSSILLSALKNFFVQAMITKYETISSRDLPLTLQILTKDKQMLHFQTMMISTTCLVGHLFNINTQVATILYLSFINWVVYSWLLRNFVVCVSLAFFVYHLHEGFFMNSCNGW